MARVRYIKRLTLCCAQKNQATACSLWGHACSALKHTTQHTYVVPALQRTVCNKTLKMDIRQALENTIYLYWNHKILSGLHSTYLFLSTVELASKLWTSVYLCTAVCWKAYATEILTFYNYVFQTTLLYKVTSKSTGKNFVLPLNKR